MARERLRWLELAGSVTLGRMTVFRRRHSVSSPPRSVHDRVEEMLAASGDGVLPVLQVGDPTLRRVADPYDGQLDDLFDDFLGLLRSTMLAAPGVGLAAPQVGVDLALAVVHDPGSRSTRDPRERVPLAHRVLVNPQLRPVPAPDRAEVERVSFYEGCLSVSGYQGVVARWRTVELVSEDEHGTKQTELLSGWPARIVQHETDHLAGMLYLDRAEIRSLTSSDNFSRFWAGEYVPHQAAAELGFEMMP